MDKYVVRIISYVKDRYLRKYVAIFVFVWFYEHRQQNIIWIQPQEKFAAIT
jgi:hypothetical protein